MSGLSQAAPALAAPTLEARDARISVDGVVAVERLSLVSRGHRVVLSGETGALLGALTGIPRSAAGGSRGSAVTPYAGADAEPPGEAFVVGGMLLLGGLSVADGRHLAVTGVAGVDLPLPPGWTAEAYVAWSARLAGATTSDARELSAVALDRCGLGLARRKSTESLSLAERRALSLAAATAGGGEILIAEAPLRGLEGSAAAFVRQALEAAASGRRCIVSVERLDTASAEGSFARTASYLAVLAGGELALDGPAAEMFAGAKIYALTVRSHADELRAELADRGIDLRGGPARFSVTLPEGARCREILAAAHAAHAAIVEMVPVIE